MGFRNGGYMTIWSIEPKSNTITKARVSSSKKNKQTGEYEQDFSGFVTFVGTAAASMAAKLKEKDHIKLGDVEVTRRYDKAKNTEYTNFNIFSFEMAGQKEPNTPQGNSNNTANNAANYVGDGVDGGEIEPENLPF